MILSELVPVDAQKLALVLLLSFLVGLEHEEHKRADLGHYMFGGVRTFPLLGILGYTLALLAPQYPALLAVGLAAVGALMLLSFRHKLSTAKSAGITSEASGLLTFLLGAVVYEEHYWIATTLVVIGVLLLELKSALEGLVKKIPSTEVLTITKFLLMAAVILPVLPDVPLTRFHIDPHRAWLIVVGISAVSYASYLLQKLTGNRGILPAAILGGAYSSTATTIALSKRSVGLGHPRLFSGAILAASGVMYLRLAALVAFFSPALRAGLVPVLAVLGLAGLAAGALWGARGARERAGSAVLSSPNPLEIQAALLFAALFFGMLVLTHVALESFGTGGVYGLSVLTGATDVDPFILGLTQSAGLNTPLPTAAVGILIAAASNNLAKGIYAAIFARGRTGRQSLLLLVLLAAAGLAPLAHFLSN